MNSNKNTLIFLDIDGVLNNETSKTVFTVADKSEDYSIDETNFQRLLKLLFDLEHFGKVKVVIHSGWIKYQHDPNATWNWSDGRSFKTLLPKVIKRLGVFSIGCIDYYPKTSKKTKILKWLEKHPEYDSWNKFVIDDDESEYNALNELIYERNNIIFCPTNPKYGLQQQTVNNIVRTVQNS